MNFEWDAEKARVNLAKHGVAFEDAELVWDDPFHQILFDRLEGTEERWWAMGLVGPTAILVVVHAYPDFNDETRVRIISARKASRHERKRYEQEIA